MYTYFKNKKWTFSLLITLGALTIFTFISPQATEENQKIKKDNHNQDAYEVTGPLTIEVTLERFYLDGEISQEVVQETILSMEDFWAHYTDWQLVKQEEGQLTFQKHVDDISPLLKANGYFGISEEGILTIYDGKPNSQNVIQSFFQIDVKKLESRQQKELKEGIRVLSKDQYEKILESFKNYSLQ